MRRSGSYVRWSTPEFNFPLASNFGRDLFRFQQLHVIAGEILTGHPQQPESVGMK